ADEQASQLRNVGHELDQHARARIVDPLQVFGDEDERSARGLYVKQSTQDRHQQPALCLGLEARALLVAEHVKEERELQVREQLAPIGEAGADRALGGGLVVGVVDQEGATDEIGDRGVWGV